MTTIVVLAIQLVLPGYLAYDIWRSPGATRWVWTLRAAAAAAFIGLLFVTGRWDVVGYWLRFVVPALFVVAAVTGYLRARCVPWLVDGRPGAWTTLFSGGFSLALFGGILGWAVSGFWYQGDAVRVSSPLQDGGFYVGQGGNSVVINYHHSHPTQRYALDILELNDWGMRADSLFPSDLGEYVIFGRPVHSPCDGRIVSIVDGLADNIPPQRQRDAPAGNHVVVACGGVHVFLAHLQRGSVAVGSGDTVARGEIVGRVGNSGNTSEPHLHMHAVRATSEGASATETPVPILLGDTFAVRNTLFSGEQSSGAVDP